MDYFIKLRYSGIGTMQNATKNCGSIDLSDGINRTFPESELNKLLEPKCSLHLAASNVTLNKIGRQAGVARTLETFRVDVWCFYGTHTESHFHHFIT